MRAPVDDDIKQLTAFAQLHHHVHMMAVLPHLQQAAGTRDMLLVHPVHHALDHVWVAG